MKIDRLQLGLQCSLKLKIQFSNAALRAHEIRPQRGSGQ